MSEKLRIPTYGSVLRVIGGLISNLLDSSFEKKLFANYWQGKGKLVLNSSEFTDIAKASINSTIVRSTLVAISGSAYTRNETSFYGNVNYDQALGVASLYVNDKGNTVGISDPYDFDPKPLGVRPLSAEIQTRLVNYFGSFRGAKGYDLCYGVGC